MKTSFNNIITGDKLSNPVLKIIYLFISFLNFAVATIFYFPLLFLFQSKIKVHKLININALDSLSSILKVQKSLFSDSRILCFDFLFNTIIKKYNTDNTQNREIRILDVGCGSGRFYSIFKHIFSKLNMKIIYIGIDIYEHDNINILRLEEDFSFVLTDANEFVKQNKLNFDIVFSQSVLEHMKYDYSLVENLNNNLHLKNTLQIHLLPSVVSLFSYVFHGYRHYSLLNIFYLFRGFHSNMNIYPIGNFFNGYSHLKNRLFTKLRLRNRAKRYLYNSQFSPIFYGVIING
jgi:SAM-dependent methyltransferase